MPIHDWSQIPPALFHDFHQSWSIRIKDALNAGRLPRGIAALVEQRSGPKESDVLAVERHGSPQGELWQCRRRGDHGTADSSIREPDFQETSPQSNDY